jgi:methylthioribose-1-phosphate isomerase
VAEIFAISSPLRALREIVRDTRRSPQPIDYTVQNRAWAAPTARSARSARLTPEGAKIRNPAFDVTPHRYIAGIITERGIFRPPYSESLREAFGVAARA